MVRLTAKHMRRIDRNSLSRSQRNYLVNISYAVLRQHLSTRKTNVFVAV